MARECAWPSTVTCAVVKGDRVVADRNEPAGPKRVLNVVTNVDHYDGPSHPTGLWLSELTQPYHVFDESGFDQQTVSPQAGRCVAVGA